MFSSTRTMQINLILQFCLIPAIFGYECQIVIDSGVKIYDYYWRDYVGVIPHDAIPGGRDEAGNPTYIGQAYSKDYEILPATIYSGCRNVKFSAYDKELTTNENIKILCSNDVKKFSWVPTKTEETHLLTNCHFVLGGHEVGHNLNIGRINHGGEIIIGKVFSYPLGNKGLWIPYNGYPVNFLSYEILTYECVVPQLAQNQTDCRYILE